MQLYVFYPAGWSVDQVEAHYQRKWGRDLVRDEFEWSLILPLRRGSCVLLAGGEPNLGGLGLTWEKQRVMESRLRTMQREVQEINAERGSL